MANKSQSSISFCWTDWWNVAIELILCRILLPGDIQYSFQHSSVSTNNSSFEVFCEYPGCNLKSFFLGFRYNTYVSFCGSNTASTIGGTALMFLFFSDLIVQNDVDCSIKTLFFLWNWCSLTAFSTIMAILFWDFLMFDKLLNDLRLGNLRN